MAINVILYKQKNDGGWNMHRQNDYLPIARANEAVFRSVLRDLKNNRAKRPGGIYVPDDLETEASLDAIFEQYSIGQRYGVFTIVDFKVEGEEATLTFQDIAALSGGGASLRYAVTGGVATYLKSEYVMMS